MKKNFIIGGIVIILTFFTGGYLFINQSHRDVEEVEVDYSISVSEFVDEYLANAKSANKKYLAADGESKILLLEGHISTVSTAPDGRLIITLKQPEQKAGIQCLFLPNQVSINLETGNIIKVKGVLRAGPGYDDDLEMFENGYLEKCSFE